MKRNIITIDRDKCNGCGLCVNACAEGAIEMVDGKAELVSEIYCDGLGVCLGECPTGALVIEEREAEAFDEKAVEDRSKRLEAQAPPTGCACTCPGSALRELSSAKGPCDCGVPQTESALSTWPVQLRLVPPLAPFLKGAHLLITADCVPLAVSDFHSRYLHGRVALVGCPKLDDLAGYAEKIKAILREAQPASVTVLRMEVPCCAGLATVTVEAAREVAPQVPLEVHTIGIGGKVEREVIIARED